MKKILSFAFVALMSGSIYAQQLVTAPASYFDQNTTVKLNNILTANQRKAAGTDLAIVRIDAPKSNCGLTNVETVIFTFKNVGTVKVANFKVGYKVGSGDTLLKMVTDSVAAGDTVQVSFAQTVNFSTVQSYSLRVFTFAAADTIVTSNNTMVATVVTTNSKFLNEGSIITGFESDDDASLFTVVTGGVSGTWQITGDGIDRFPRTGKKHASTFVGAAGDNNDFLVSNCLEMNKGDKYVLNFWYKVSNAPRSIIGKLDVILGRSADFTRDTQLMFRNEQIVSEDYVEYRDTFEVAETGGYRLALRDFSNSLSNPGAGFMSYAFSIDDLSLIKIRDTVVVISEIITPKTSCNLTSSEKITLKVTNNGKVSVSNFPVSFKIGTSPAIVETITGTLLPGQSLDYTFAAKAAFGTPTSFKLQAKTKFTLSGEELNKTIKRITATKLTTNASKLFTSFEVETDLDGWETVDANNDKVFWGRAGQNGFESTSALSFNANSNISDDWIFSKCVQFEPAKKYYVSFAFLPILDDVNYPKFEVTLNNAQIPDSLEITEPLFNFDAPQTGEYLLAEAGQITVDKTASYYIGIHNYSDENGGQLFVDSFQVRIDNYTGIDASELHNAVSIYPNPVKNTLNLNVSFSKQQDITVNVIDILGKVVMSKVYNVSENNIRMDIADLTPGMYTLRVNTKTDFTTEKFMVVE